ncbi:YecA family protein [Burkholderiaceae bacterium UC74_6]
MNNKPFPPKPPARPGLKKPGVKPGIKPDLKPSEKPSVHPLTEDELARLEQLLDAVPAPLEPLDLSMLDGYLTGVLLQPKAVPTHLWTINVLDAEDGRKPPESFDAKPLLTLVKRRYSELNAAIAGRQWFDPLVFELEDTDNPSEILLPWVAGFALATEIFPDLMRQDAAALLEPLASIFMHLDPDDLEDADELLEEIESLEPPTSLEDAVEGLVSAVLMLADITRPQKDAPTSAARSGRKPPGRVQAKPRRY